MMLYEGAINASRRKNWCVATQKIMHRDEKNSHFTAIFHPIAMHSTELSHEAPHALKGQKLLAQGIALGFCGSQTMRPVRAKALKNYFLNAIL